MLFVFGLEVTLCTHTHTIYIHIIYDASELYELYIYHRDSVLFEFIYKKVVILNLQIMKLLHPFKST